MASTASVRERPTSPATTTSAGSTGASDRAGAGGPAGTGTREIGGPSPASAWLIGPWMLAAVVCGAVLVLRGPDRVFGGALGLFLGASIAWILVSVLWPARPDRTCPACGESSLGRMDAETTRGIVCSACGHRDEAQSSFLMAEEDGDAIEKIRLAARSTATGSPTTRSTEGPVRR